MSGESIYNIIKPEVEDVTESPYTGKYEKHFKEMAKPAYSTFYQKGKEYDGTHPRYFKQRDAVIGKNVNETVDPKNFLRAGEGVKFSIPPVQERKIFTKPPLDHRANLLRGSEGKKHFVPDSGIIPGNKEGETNFPYDGIKNGKGRDGENLGISGKGKNGKDETIYESLGNIDNIKDKYHDDQNLPSRELGNGKDDINEKYPCIYENVEIENLRNGITGNDLYRPGALDGKKDFVTSNIIQVSNMVPKRRKDQPENFTCRKSFGEVPGYLGRVKQEINEEKMHLKAIEDVKTQQRIQQMSKHVYRLKESERLDLIAKLKSMLNSKSSELNKMPFVKDTFTQVKRRAELEKGIKEIEIYLTKLDKDALFIYNDDPRYVNCTKGLALDEARRFASQPTN